MMKALSQLSAYIKASLEEKQSIWIAQKEGRAKDGNDKTDPAILKMFFMEGRHRKEAFSDYVAQLRIVPVTISYENDPCDAAKANELYRKQQEGGYEKGEFEDIESIVQGIVGQKRRIHVAFGDVIGEASKRQTCLLRKLTVRSIRIITCSQATILRRTKRTSRLLITTARYSTENSLHCQKVLRRL